MSGWENLRPLFVSLSLSLKCRAVANNNGRDIARRVAYYDIPPGGILERSPRGII